jgi:hypothetical protein
MACRICFNRHQQNQSSSDYIRKKKAVAMYTSPNLEGTIIKNEYGRVLQTRSYATLMDLAKGGTIYNNKKKYATNTTPASYSIESYQMYYTQKDVCGDKLIVSNYNGIMNQLDPDDESTVIINISSESLNHSCGQNKKKTVTKCMFPGDALEGFIYPYKIQLPMQSSTTCTDCIETV